MDTTKYMAGDIVGFELSTSRSLGATYPKEIMVFEVEDLYRSLKGTPLVKGVPGSYATVMCMSSDVRKWSVIPTPYSRAVRCAELLYISPMVQEEYFKLPLI